MSTTPGFTPTRSASQAETDAAVREGASEAIAEATRPAPALLKTPEVEISKEASAKIKARLAEPRY